MTDKEEFISIFKENITREGSDKLLDFLENRSDFFTAPASTRYHNAFEGGLLRHSLNVYHCLVAYLERKRVKNEYGLSVSAETAAIVALLHDVCKVNFYRVGWRNVKNEQTGQWESSHATRSTIRSHTVTARNPSIWSAATYASPARRQWRSDGTWDSPEPRIRTR